MNKQGRPRFDDDLIRQVQERFPDVTSRRGQQELVYAIEAYNVLKEIPSVGFLWNYDELGNRKGMKRKLVTELGRFRDPGRIKEIGIRVCADQKHQPKSVEEWTRVLRKMRLEEKGDSFIKGELSMMPCLVLQSFPHPGVGLVGLGKIIELPIRERTNVAAPIYGAIPPG